MALTGCLFVFTFSFFPKQINKNISIILSNWQTIWAKKRLTTWILDLLQSSKHFFYHYFIAYTCSYIHWSDAISGHLTFFAPVQKMKIALKKSNSMEKSKGLSRLCQLSHFKMTGRSCTDKVREKVTSFQKVTLFSVTKYCAGTLSIYILISLKLWITAVI